MKIKKITKIGRNGTLTQIAFGADSHATSNPDLFAMMDYCRNNDYNKVVPNITVAQITDETADKLAKYCGAVAISRYADKNVCYDSVQKLTDRGMTQINIHIMVSEETFDQVMETLNDRMTDPRLSKLNAIVLLSLKQKGRGINFHPLSYDKFKQIVDFSMDKGISIGFDSCSACKFLASVKDRDNYDELEMMAEPCESGLFSIYINSEGKVYPCSFSEEIEDWEDGIEVASCDDFLKDIWFGERISKWRKGLLNNKRSCPVYSV